MRSNIVVIVYVLNYQLTKFPGGTILIWIELLRLEAAKPAFNHDVVGPAALAIHTLTDIKAAKQIFVIIACKLAALVRIDDGGNTAFLDSFLYGMDN